MYICAIGDAPREKQMKGNTNMKKSRKSDELTDMLTFDVTIEGLTLQDIIEILALRGETLPERVTILLKSTK